MNKGIKVSKKNWGLLIDTMRNTLYWDTCDKCFKMLVMVGDDIPTIINNEEGKRLHLIGTYKIRQGFVAEYEREVTNDYKN